MHGSQISRRGLGRRVVGGDRVGQVGELGRRAAVAGVWVEVLDELVAHGRVAQLVPAQLDVGPRAARRVDLDQAGGPDLERAVRALASNTRTSVPQ